MDRERKTVELSIERCSEESGENLEGKTMTDRVKEAEESCEEGRECASKRGMESRCKHDQSAPN